MNDINKKEEAFSLFDALHRPLAKMEEKLEQEKRLPPKLASKDLAALKKLEKHKPLSSDQCCNLVELLVKHDPNLKLLQQTATAVSNHPKAGVSAALIEDCARVIHVYLTNDGLAQKPPLFLSIWESTGQSNSISRFVDLLDNQIKLSLKGLSEKTVEEKHCLPSSSQFYEEQQLFGNIRSGGLIWLIVKGLADIDKLIDYLIEQNTYDIEIAPTELTKLGLFVTESALPKRDSKFFMLMKHLKLKQDQLQKSKNLEITRRTQIEKELDLEQKKVAERERENSALNEKISSLESSLNELNQKLDKQHSLGQAERVHLKDDHGKAKYKTLNTLEEDVLPLIEKTNHALHKDVPKVHIATHQLELITDEIKGLIKWLKK